MEENNKGIGVKPADVEQTNMDIEMVDADAKPADMDMEMVDAGVEPANITDVLSERQAGLFSETDITKIINDAMQPVPDMLDASAKALEQANQQINTLTRLFESKMRLTEHQQKMIDDMRDELHKYREDQYFKLLRPAIRDIIDIRESMRRMAASLYKKEGPDGLMPISQFAGYINDFENMLEEYDIKCYHGEHGAQFDGNRQTCIKKIAVGDETLHGRIAESLGDGYVYNGRVIFAERVSAYVYDSSLKKDTPLEEI